jgi:outer membrane receptor protein involved in Fe transport
LQVDRFRPIPDHTSRRTKDDSPVTCGLPSRRRQVASRIGIAAAFAIVLGTATRADASPFAVVHPIEPPAPAADDDIEVRTVKVRTRSDGLTASGRRIGSDQIATSPKRSAEDLLRMVPGLLIVQHGNQGKGYQFYVRGFDAVHGSDIEFEVGDVPVNEPSNVHAHGYLDLAWIIPEAVKQIDAHKGAFRLDQGNFATAASIRYELGVPKKLRGTRVSYEIGTTQRHRVAVVHAPKSRGEETFIAAEAMFDEGYGSNRQARRLSAMGQMRLWERDGWGLDALATAYGADFGLPGTTRLDELSSGRIEFYDAYTTDTKGKSQRTIAALRFGGSSGNNRLSTTLWAQGRRLGLDENYTGALLDPVHGDRHRQHQDAAALGVSLDYERQLSDTAALRIVGTWRGDAIDQGQDEVLDSGAIWAKSRDLAILQQTFGIAPGVRITPRKWFLLDAGVRFDAYDGHVRDRLQPRGRQEYSGSLVQISPRASTRFTIRDRWQLFAAYGRGFRTPEARAFTLPPSPPENVDLDVYAGGKPQMTTTENVEVGARVQPSELFDVGMAMFGIWIGRESLFDHVSGFNIELGGTRRLGVEGDVQIHPTKWLDIGVDVTAVHARFTDSDGKIPGAPPLFVQIQGALNHPKGYRAGVRWFVLGPRPLTYGAKAGAATIMDLSVGYRMKWLQLDLSVENVFGARWREGEYNFASWWDRSERPSQIPAVHYVAGPPTMARLSATVFW